MPHIVVFNPDGKCAEVEEEASLLQAARSAGVPIDSECGGQGVCGKCKVRVLLGETGGGPGDQLSEQEIADGYVLACQAEVAGDVVVEVPVESQLGELQILMGLEEGLEPSTPLAEKIRLTLEEPSQEEPQSDLERLYRAIRAQSDVAGELGIDASPLRELPVAARQADWRLWAALGDLEHTSQVIALGPDEGSALPGYGLAIDVGTTTVVVQLIDLETGGLVEAEASLNQQISYGDDVISRIIASTEMKGGLAKLHDAIVATINSLIEEICQAQQMRAEDILGAACAGNTVMTHFLLGMDAAAIRRAPYVAGARRWPILRASDIGLAIHPGGLIYISPSVSSYVGGDIMAGVLATGVADSPQLSLFIDMGTNGEIVLGNSEWLVCCSCSAGPAFEGSGIEDGMYAGLGAIERFGYQPERDRSHYSTIAQARPRGICGSGLIDALAAMVETGVVDRAGHIDQSFASPRVRIRSDRPEFVLVWGSEIGREQDLALNEEDVQTLMRSKAAVYAATSLLLERMNLRPADLDRVLVAGAFGNYLDAENAVTVGLLPDIPLEKIRFVGNTSVAGARMALVSRASRQRLSEIAGQMTNLELSTEPDFMDYYVASLFLPHTDLSRFPSVAGRLEGGTS